MLLGFLSLESLVRASYQGVSVQTRTWVIQIFLHLVVSTLGSSKQKLHTFFAKGNSSGFNRAVDFVPSFQVAVEKKSSKGKVVEILEKFISYYLLK